MIKTHKSKKIRYISIIFLFVLLVSIGVPTLARYKNRSSLSNIEVWNGTIASSYRSGTGTESDPYVISNGEELAYLSTQLATTNYENVHFKLIKDIILNNGIFQYNTENGITYILNSTTYYINDYTNNYYDNLEHIGNVIGTVNEFNSFKNFKGVFDGNSHTIYGLYIESNTEKELALFTNLEGNISDLYLDNTMIYGGLITGGLSSIANNSIIKNTFVNGNIVGKNTNIETVEELSVNVPVSILNNIETTNIIDLSNNLPLTGSEIVSTSLTGEYTIENPTAIPTLIKINNMELSSNNFDVDLGNSILNSVPILTYTESQEEIPIKFSNVKYNITYKQTATSGIVAKGKNNTISNSINKASIYGYSVAGGIIGITTETASLNHSYNKGKVVAGNISGGIIGLIENVTLVELNQIYNTGEILSTNNGNLLGIIKNSETVNINNSFSTSSLGYIINNISNATVNINSSYYNDEASAIKTGSSQGNFIGTNILNFQNQAYLETNLKFSSFIDYTNLQSNTENVWVFEEEEIPYLFLDDSINSIAHIYANTYKWDNLSPELRTIWIENAINFNITLASELHPISAAYYYISNNEQALTKDDLKKVTNWTTYKEALQINSAGTYVIYIKVEDYNNNEYYLNTDILKINTTGSIANIEYNNEKWSNLRNNPNEIYVGTNPQILITLNANQEDIKEIKYYISNDILNSQDLNNITDDLWNTYQNNIEINSSGKNIIYAKVTDYENNITYLNSDFFILEGYSISNLIIGKNSSSYNTDSDFITNKSAITLTANYIKSSANNIDYTHVLKSNILLPENTKITIVDKIKNKIYTYKIPTSEDNYNYNNSCPITDLDCVKSATYPFTLFKELGNSNNSYQEDTYYTNGTIDENYVITIDFSMTNITANYESVNIYLEAYNNDQLVRPTLNSSFKSFSIYSISNETETNASLTISSPNIPTIRFNENQTNDINIFTEIVYKTINEIQITDTTMENKKIGLLVKILDSEGQIVQKEKYKNMIFKIGTNNYYPSSDNIIYIPLGKAITSSSTLTIITNSKNGNLEIGNYFIKLSNYISIDGYIVETLNNNEVTIPLLVEEAHTYDNIKYNVLVNDEDRLINKEISSKTLTFNMTIDDNLEMPNVKVSLYKKDELTAYNQNYSIIDLKDYVSNDLIEYQSKIYNAIQSINIINEQASLELVLLTSNFESGGYKFVFDLYDGTKKVTTIEKYFIIK